MSIDVCKAAIEGTIVATSFAEIRLNQALYEYGPDQEIAYPDTGYELPVISGLEGTKVTKLGQLPRILNKFKKNLKEDEFDFEEAKMAGELTAISAEIIEALKYIGDEDPYEDEVYTGFVSDGVLRELGVPLVDGTIPGIALIVGKARSSEEAAELVKDLQGKGILTVLNDQIIEQLIEEDVKIGLDYLTIPLGHFTQVIHVVNFAVRAALAFGGEERGDYEAILTYIRDRIKAFVLVLGELDEVRIAAGMAANHLGLPVITDQDVQEIPDWFVTEKDYEEAVQLGLELQDIHIEIVDIPVPITVGPAFEGEQIRSSDMYVEFGGQRTPAFELVKMREKEEVEDGKVEVIGPDIEDIEDGDKLPLGIFVDVYGRNMEEDFEGVFERRVHYFCNYGEGLWHVGQRDINWVRISKDAVDKGFTIEGIGHILYAKFKSEYPSLIDRLQVRIITDEDKIEEGLEEARARYKKRDDRMRELTDESVDVFYDCTLCQSFAPNHVCIVTPDRVGLCGAVSWLDAKAAYEIEPTGPNQPVELGECIDDHKGQWTGCNERQYKESSGNIEEVNIYSIIDKPMTSCGCFEAIMAMLPEANGFMIVNREFAGQTPVGMKFSTLAGTVGGGNQTPGFMGIGKSYVASPKFVKGDGGIRRIVWIPKELKEHLKEDIERRGEELGLDNFYDMIADETVGTTVDEVLPYLEEKGHPALEMGPLMG